MRVLMVDNYDSFTYNLVHLLEELGAEVLVRQSDAITPEEAMVLAQYHSLAAVRIPDALEVSSRTADGEVMGVRHRTLPIEGVQFHPESVLTPQGPAILRNFLDTLR